MKAIGYSILALAVIGAWITAIVLDQCNVFAPPEQPRRENYDVRVTSDRPFLVIPYDPTNPPLRILYPDSPKQP